jgi:hypothetical protein
LQAGEAVGHEAFAPLAHGVPVAVEFAGDLPIAGPIVLGGTENEPATKDQRLRCRAGADQGLQLLANFGAKYDTGTERTSHERPPCCSADTDAAITLIL